jgi:hypothetical protein
MMIILSCSICEGQNLVTLTLKPDSTNGKDAYVWDYFPSNNYGNNDRLDVTAWTAMGTPYISRVFIQFDLDSIPAFSTIVSAYLSLFRNYTDQDYNGIHSGANASYIQRVIGLWQKDSITWNNQPSAITTNQVSLPQTITGLEDFTNIDVKNMVVGIMASSNFGFMIKLQTEHYYTDLIFASSRHADSTIHPKLVVTYLTSTSIEHNANNTSDINIFPNSFSDELNIKTSIKEPSEIILYDIVSRKLLQQKFTSSVTLNTAQLARGIYIYEVKNKEGVVKKGKVVKE